MIYGFHNLRGFHSFAKVHWFLVPWPFRGFTSDCQFWGKLRFWYGFMFWIGLAICYKDGHFLDFMNLGDSIALPRSIGF